MIVSEALLGSGFFIPEKSVPFRLLESFQVSSKFEDGVTISLWERSLGGLIKLPRYFDRVKAANITDRTAAGGSLSFNILTDYRDGQQDILDRFSEYKDQGNTGFLVVAPTGVGKTRIAIDIVKRLGRTTLVVVPKSDLLQQWYKELLLHTDIPKESIGLGEGGAIDWSGKAVCIVIADTLSKDREGDAFRHSFGTVVFDEVDRRIPAKTLNAVMGLLPAKYRVAITATPKRRDGLDVLIDYHVAQCKVISSFGKKMPAHIYACNYSTPRMLYDNSSSGAIQRRAILLKQLATDKARNHLIAMYVNKLVGSGRRCAVVSDRIAHLKAIASILDEKYGFDKEVVGFYTKSSTTEKERARALKSCQVIMATYGLFGAGTNVPDLSGLVLASPLVSVTQVVGRVERFIEGKKQPVVIDIIDVKSPIAKGWFNARLREYTQRKLKVTYNG